MDSRGLTALINSWQSGDDAALEELMPHIYKELRRLARSQMQREVSSHTLQATALVNEAFIRLADVKISYKDRSHFLAMAARTMRRVLVDHARAKNTGKRGGGVPNVTLDEGTMMSTQSDPEILDVDQALTELAAVDQRLVDTIELIYFGGLSYSEAAAVLGVSKTTVFADVKIAKAWLLSNIGAVPDHD